MCVSQAQPNSPDKPSLVWPSVDELLAQSRLLRAATSGGTANVYVYEMAGRKFLVKTFAKHNFLMRWLFGRKTIRNEWSILQALKKAGVQEVPKVYALLESYTLVMEFVDGKQLQGGKHYGKDTMPGQPFFERLRAMLWHCHQLGFAHGDFRRANVMIRNDGSPCVIDWATASFCPVNTPKWHFLRRGFNSQMQKSDRYTLVKMLPDYYPEMISEQDRQAARASWMLQIGHFLRRYLYRHGIKEWVGRARHGKQRQKNLNR